MDTLRLHQPVQRLVLGYIWTMLIFAGIPSAVIIRTAHPSRQHAILIVVVLVVLMLATTIATSRPWRGAAGFDADGVRALAIPTPVPWDEIRDIVVEPSPQDPDRQLIRIVIAWPESFIDQRAPRVARKRLRANLDQFGTPIVWDSTSLVMDVAEVSAALRQHARLPADQQ